jgi:hypothetical protein
MGGRKTDPVEALVGRYARWLGGEPDQEALGNLDLVLSVRRDYLGGDPCTWHEGEITELLLDVFPRKVQSDPSLLRDGPAVLGAFLRYLEQTDQLRGSRLYQLQAELAEVGPRFAQSMQDSSRFGLAKSLFAAMTADGVAVDDPDAIQKWIEEFNARPFAERAVLTDAARTDAARTDAAGTDVAPTGPVADSWATSSTTEPVLQALAASAPPVISKAARKALFSLRSARRR